MNLLTQKKENEIDERCKETALKVEPWKTDTFVNFCLKAYNHR